MKGLRDSVISGVVCGIVLFICFAFCEHSPGCTAAQLASADKAIGGTPLSIVQVPTTQPGVYSTTQPSAGQLTIHLVQDGATIAAPILAGTGTPWGEIAAIGLTVVSGVLGVFATKQTSALNTAQNVITAAAPGVAQLVQQVTDNKTLATDVTHIGQVAPGVIDLLTHPSASNILQATGTIVGVDGPTGNTGAIG